MKTIASIQVLRGVAAMGVVVFHARLELSWRHIAVPLPDFLIGAAGVDLFFVISGFIITYASRNLFASPANVVPFLAHRIVRIVPLYWLFTVVRVVYIFVANRHSALLDNLLPHLLSSLAFIPQGNGVLPIIQQGWTLNCEMAFYLCFALCLPLRMSTALACLSAGFLGLAVLGLSGIVEGRAAEIVNSQLCEFVAGMVIARAYLAGFRLKRRHALVLVGLAGIAFLLATARFEGLSAWRGLVWGLPAAAVVAAATLAADETRAAAHPWLLGLGNASYAIYLTHMLVFTIMSRILLKVAFLGPAGAIAYLVVLVAAAVVAGLWTYRWIERPMFDAMRSRLQRRALFRLPRGGAGTARSLRQPGI